MVNLSLIKIITFIYLVVSVTCVVKYTNSYLLTGTIQITCDDIVESITVNGVSATLSGSTNDWTSTKTVNAAIKPGDIVAIACSNLNPTISSSDPAGMIATIRYVDENGVTAYLSTGTRWLCNGKYPMFKGTNGNSVWYSGKGGPQASIDNNASWIWGETNPQKTTCSVGIPTKTNATINVAVDDNLLEIRVNGVLIWIYGKLNEDREIKIIDTFISPGDVVSIKGSNFNGVPTTTNPAGILATIIYLDATGKSVNMNTGSAWTCDGQPPLSGNRNVRTYSPMAEISQDASCIWGITLPETSTCTVTIPK